MRIKFTKTLFCLFCSILFFPSVSQVTFQESFTSSLNQMTAANGSNGNWIWSNNCSKSTMSGHTSPGHALFSGSSCQFGNSFSPVAGDLVSPSISVGSLGAILSFNYALNNECATYDSLCPYDILTLQISNNGGGSFTDVLSSEFNVTGLTNDFAGSGWKAVTYSLTAYAGQNIIIRFNFNSVDGVGNNYDGVYVDDIKVEDITPCSGTPASNTIIPSTTLVCPGYGNAVLNLANSYAQGNIQFSWLTTTVSSVGPFTPVSGATSGSYPTTTLNTTTWYQAVITCATSQQSFTTAAIQINVAAVTTNTAPYFEGFEGIQANNQLPNCSWSATSPNTVTRTYTTTMTQNRTAHTGSKFASFHYSPNGVNYFYTNSIYMYSGVTYSASLWYATDAYGDLNWSDLSIMLGTTPSTTGLVSIASTNGPASSLGYKSLANTFTVGTSGYYHVAIRATSAGCCAPHLNWDDLAIEIPCALNIPSVALITSDTVICAGETITITANGADNYLWNTGATTNAIVDMPSVNTVYYVTGTNAITGCKQSAQSVYVTVNPSPNMAVFADKPTICSGASAVITALGADTYTWAGFNTNNNFITVNPTSSNTYTVIGANQYNCQVTLTQLINVSPSPTVFAQADRTEICRGEEVLLDGSGALTYQWTSPALFVQSQVAMAYPQVSTSYTLTGINAQGCTAYTTIQVIVEECVGIETINATQNTFKAFPNPNSGVFTIQSANGKLIEITDVSGRVVYRNSTPKDELHVDISSFSHGVYYVKVKSGSSDEVIKILKQ